MHGLWTPIGGSLALLVGLPSGTKNETMLVRHCYHWCFFLFLRGWSYLGVFCKLWQVLHMPLLLGLQHIFATRHMPLSMRAGIAFPIPKGGTSFELHHWWPITLLFTTFKVIAHLFSNHLKASLSYLIHSSVKLY